MFCNKPTNIVSNNYDPTFLSLYITWWSEIWGAILKKGVGGLQAKILQTHLRTLAFDDELCCKLATPFSIQ